MTSRWRRDTRRRGSEHMSEADESDAQMKVVLPGTCATCSNRTAEGSYDLDILDPEGEVIAAEPIKNWKNRDTFGCTAWVAKTDGAAA